jgi:hypothetical protein
MSIEEKEPEKCEDCGKNIRASDSGICNTCLSKQMEDLRGF